MDVTFLDDPRFAWARFTGPWTIDQICAQVDRVLADCLARKQRLLLVDWSLLESKRVSTLERYRLAASTQVFSEKLDKVAAVMNADMIDPENFGSRVAQNRGVNIRTFPELEEARRWLLEKERPARPAP